MSQQANNPAKENSTRTPIGLQHSKTIPHKEERFNLPLNKNVYYSRKMQVAQISETYKWTKIKKANHRPFI